MAAPLTLPGKLKLGATLWLLAMAGVVVLLFTVLPAMVQSKPHALPLAAIQAASAAQSGIMLLLAVWAGVAWGRPLGLSAPVLDAALTGRPAWPLLRDRLRVALACGVAVGLLLSALGPIAPAPLRALGAQVDLPLSAKLLYGGITEEILMRWGVMTALLWLPWKLLQKGAGKPRGGYVVAAIAIAAVLFGVGHLPAAAALGAPLSPSIVAFIVAGNALPGLMFGSLYWRRGIESACIAHALSHLTAVAAAVLIG